MQNQDSLRREIVFVDSGVESYESLINGVRSNITDVFRLDSTQDGVWQISEKLSQLNSVAAIHIVSHGQPGKLLLGATELSLNSLQRDRDRLQVWSKALLPQADILLYGCNLAATPSGLQLVEQISKITGANVAAATTNVGNSALGGKWELDAVIGKIKSALAFPEEVMAAYGGVLEASAYLKVDQSGNGINSSTFSSGSFQLTNNSTTGQKIRRIFIDTSAGFLPDIIFDPNGTGGDTIAKALTLDSNPGVGNVTTNYLLAKDGGFQGLEILFTDFGAGKTLTFSIDMDPTSTKGTAAPGPQESASVSGLEMIGSIVTVEFDDNTSITGELYRIPDSVDGSQVFLKLNQPTTPTIEILGVSGSQAIVESANQTVRITGTPGAQVSLLSVGGAMFTKTDGTAFDIDPFEANSVTGVNEVTVTIGASGTVDVPITLSTLSTQNGYKGFNYIMAAQKLADGTTGPVSNVKTLQLNLPSTPTEVKIEAEAFVLNTFRKETLTAAGASGGQGISFVGSAGSETGTAYFDFTGAAALYDIYLSYWDENDGVGSVNLSVNGTQLGTVNFNQSTSSGSPTTGNKREAKVAQAVSLQQGSRIQLQGFEESNEATRIDFIRLVPVSGTPTNTAPTSTGIANVSVVQNAQNTVIKLFDVFADAQDADTALTYSIVSNTNPNLFEAAPSINSSTGELTLNYSPTATGGAQITVRATDTAGLFTDTSFNVNVTEPAPVGEIKIEAENMVLTGFKKENLSGGGASNGQGISFVGGASNETGTASIGFAGATGTYDIYVSFWDESDGNSRLELLAGGTLLNTLTFNQSPGGTTATTTNKREVMLAQAVSLQPGTLIELRGYEDASEHARTDFIRFVPSSGTPANTAPTSTGIADISVVKNAANTVIKLFDVFSDLQDSDTTLKYSIVNNTNGALFEVAPSINATTGELTLNYSPTATGTAQLTVRATDTGGLSTDVSFAVNVTTPPPVGEIKIEAESLVVIDGFRVENLSSGSGGKGLSLINGAANETGTAYFDFEGAADAYDIYVSYWDETDGNARLEVSAGGSLLNTLTFNQSPGGSTASAANKVEKLVAQAVALQSGTRIQLKGFEDAGEAVRTDYIRLVPASGTPINTAPSTTGIANVSVTQNAPNTVINLFDAFSDLQDPDTALKYDVVKNTNAGLFEVAPSINSTNGQLTLNYSPTATGSSQLTVRATDTGGLFTDTTFTVNVIIPGNTAPTTSGIGNVTVTQNASDTLINLWNAFADAQDADSALTYTVTGNTNAGLFEVAPSINPTTGQLTLNYSPTATGSSQLTVQAKDTGGLSTSTSFTVNVTAANAPIPPGDILVEAEDMVLSGYRIETSSGIGAYGGKLITFVNGSANETGTANFVYSGAAGTYDLNLAFWDESDGNANFEVYVNDTLRGTVNSNRNINGATATINNKWEIRAIENLAVKSGDRIQIKGFEESGDAARLDYVRLTQDKSIRINTGTGTSAPNNAALYTDTTGRVWNRDVFSVGGIVSAVASTTEIFKTNDDALYQNVRSAKDLSYQIPVAEGAYTLKLHFVEPTKTNYAQRVFDVKVEGDLVLDDLDIFEESKNAFFPGQNSALVKTIDQPFFISDGFLNLDLNASVDVATIAGIEVIALEGPAVIIKQTNGDTQVNEAAGNDTYEVVLNTKPTANVTININSGNQLNTNKTAVTFTPTNWDTPQTVTVTAINDTAAEGIHYTTITHTASSTDSNYNNLTVRSLPVTVLDDDVVAISFNKKIVDITNVNDPSITADDNIANVANPTVGAWGPDGRLYVGFYDGSIRAYTFDDNYNVTAIQAINTIKGLYNAQILGIAFNPYDTEPKIYVSHSKLYANGGGAFPETQLSPYSGEVSVLSGANFSNRQSLISGIGVSNHDHGVNGLEFDNKGDLYIVVGSNTNAGITADEIGGVPESYFTAAMLKAEITKANFNGKIEYTVPAGSIVPTSFPSGYTPPPGETIGAEDHQLNGGVANVVPGVDVSVYASGLRNSFDLVYTTKGKIYATDNGANAGFGDFSTSATTQQPMVSGSPDELNLITQGAYYGSPNRNRGRTDDRQNVYYKASDPSIPGKYTAPIATMTASTNGIVEYRATAFNGQLRGNLLAQDWNGPIYRFQMNADGTQVKQKDTMTGVLDGLDLLTGPGGALLGIDLSDDAIAVATPLDPAAINMTVYDIFPWRAPAIGGQSFVLGGDNFGTLADTTVTVGGVAAKLSYVSDNRIKGTLPTLTPTGGDLLDITVKSGGETYTLTDAYLPLA
ncbi:MULTISPECIES: DUF4347 domain-containing protein [Calothrix]|uniref:DUF4347 domain-containing protein n=2 Tax=Calothrix TaxID=1186 RepID=A0ABR8A370_9CYAN|nr:MULTISPECIES: DUF4347 domain-containing protein [Calothrix]MBD2194373.1 DUF4347 domain-containing protein [Calothrix parietina FACHB-288]MBD2223155.1 DUF4347 domain-containing protein [Calothrix anomala FACHB-343]